MNLLPIGPNQTELASADGKRRLLWSYRTPVAAIVDGIGVRTTEKFSVTTSRHISAWLAANGQAASTVTKPQTYFETFKV